MSEDLADRADTGRLQPLGAQAAALERLRQATVPGVLAAVTGEAGLGKSTLRALFERELPARTVPVVIADPTRSRPDTRFLRTLLSLAGAEPHGRTGLDLTTELLERIRTLGEEGRGLAIVIDDAHRLASSQLDILRTLLASASAAYPVSVAVFGEPEILDRIARKRRLAERLSIQIDLEPWNAETARRLLDACLRPETRDALTDDAIDSLVERGAGNPASLIRLAERLGDLTIRHHESRIDRDLVERVTTLHTEHDMPRQTALPLDMPTGGDSAGDRRTP
jgi:type II secretory pathway predicted ATPase ExeA